MWGTETQRWACHHDRQEALRQEIMTAMTLFCASLFEAGPLDSLYEERGFHVHNLSKQQLHIC